jgi:uncharacterized protein
VRNIFLFILVLIGIFYVRRALRRTGRADGQAADEARGAPAEAPREQVVIEQMVACVHCGLHVPESEGLHGAGGFYCSEEHRRLGPHS